MPKTSQNKPEKTDWKQELMDKVMGQYKDTPVTGLMLLKSIEAQNKQIEDAHAQGMTTEDFAKSIGVDLSPMVAKQLAPPQEAPQQAPQQQKGPGMLETLSMLIPGVAPARAMAQALNSKREEEQSKDIYQYDPFTSQVTKVATVPGNAEVRNKWLSPEEKVELAKNMESIKRESPERVQMSSNLDVMDSLLTDMQGYISKNPNAMLKGPIDREFRAIVDSFDQVAAIAAGGKQLTKTELDLIRRTRPTWLDTKNPKAIEYKFNILKNTLGLAKERLNKSTQYEKKSKNTFATEEEAMASGIKGEVVINGRRARID